MDVGFRADASDNDRLEIEGEEEKVAEDYDSEDTNDEIYSAHEGVDFRPSIDEQFSFAA